MPCFLPCQMCWLDGFCKYQYIHFNDFVWFFRNMKMILKPKVRMKSAAPLMKETVMMTVWMKITLWLMWCVEKFQDFWIYKFINCLHFQDYENENEIGMECENEIVDSIDVIENESSTANLLLNINVCILYILFL